jgi:SAM-dependent methyltransferase
VVAVEPARRMRQEALARRHPRVRQVGGDALAIPLAGSSCDAAWLSTVIHHLPDLEACARELARVLSRDAPVLIRSSFPGRHAHISLFRYFPGASRVADTFPSVATTVGAFARAGFAQEALESVPQVSARSLREAYERVCLRADSTLVPLNDEEFAAGLAAIEKAAREEKSDEPVVDRLDLLVLRRATR